MKDTTKILGYQKKINEAFYLQPRGSAPDLSGPLAGDFTGGHLKTRHELVEFQNTVR